jgi:flagellar basal-body rod protein FlgB
MDKLFGVHDEALILRSRRSEILARNLANADTPNYLARDVDFPSLLAAATGHGSAAEHVRSPSLAVTRQGHANGGGPMGEGELLYRTPMQPSIDGNTVNADQERAEFTRNALAYEASLRFLNSRVRSLIGALKGE